MKTKDSLFHRIGFILVAGALASCQAPTLVTGGSGNVNLNLALAKTTASGARLAANASAAIQSVVISVSGSGMSTITKTFAADNGPYSLSVAAGTARTFSAVVNYDSSTTFQTQWTGTATADLTQGSNVDLTITPTWTGSPILVMDRGNNRIVQIDDMNGTNWTTNNYLSNASSADFDSAGNLYVVVSSTGIFRFSSIKDQNPTQILNQTGIYSVAIDRPHNVLYYAYGGAGCSIFSVNLSQPIQASSLTVTGANAYTLDFYSNAGSITADDLGYVYAVAHDSNYAYYVLKISSSSGGLAGSFSLADTNIGSDYSVSGVPPMVKYQNGRLFVIASSWNPIGLSPATGQASLILVVDPISMNFSGKIENDFMPSGSPPQKNFYGGVDLAAFYGRRLILKGQLETNDGSNHYFVQLTSAAEDLTDLLTFGAYGNGTGAFGFATYAC